MKLGATATLVLAALRRHVESEIYDDDGKTWGTVYLDNVPCGDSAVACLTPRQFAGYLGALERKGLYKSQNDDCFGSVLIEQQ